MKQIELLKKAVEEAEEKNKIKLLNTDGVKKIFEIVESFIKNNKGICYGGTAINNILPLKDQFYKPHDIPDYDFFSKTPMEDAVKLCDIYYKSGFKNTETKSGLHAGTYKVFVDFIPVADITFIESQFFDNIIKDCIKKNGILYAPPNFLRMALYLELSRPDGDVSRWEKVFTRLELLNKYYPIKEECVSSPSPQNSSAFKTLLTTFSKNNVVFFGGYALSLYSELFLNAQPFFYVISTDSKKVAHDCVVQLQKINIRASIVTHEEVVGYVGKSYEITVNKRPVAFIYEPIACYNYNSIVKNGIKINIATTDTMLSFYFMFLYINQEHYDTNRIICMCRDIIKLQEKNGNLMKRFTLNCIGKQKTQRDIFFEKDLLFQKYKNDKTNKNFTDAFFRYKPDENLDKTRKTKHRPKQRFKQSRKHKKRSNVFNILKY